ncbi:RNase H domain-containing protein [Trichonephila clavipes]|nr:RNase H domain-containing protein [Trichonephila clavipes]
MPQFLYTASKERHLGTCSVFRSQLIAINVEVDAILSSDCDFGGLWILLDSHGALQRHSGWSSANNETSVFILLKLRKISQTDNVHFHTQGIPLPVNTGDNGISDRDWPKRVVRMKRLLALLTYQELYSNTRSYLNLIPRIPPTHQRYKGTSPGSLLEIKCDRGS